MQVHLKKNLAGPTPILPFFDHHKMAVSVRPKPLFPTFNCEA